MRPRDARVRAAGLAGLLAAMALPLATAGSPAMPAASAIANWFDDPFVQVASAHPGCPEPLGPRMDAAERRVQAHHRAERGTTCYLAGQCAQPNAYLYDRAIADRLVERLRASPRLRHASLWVTVQGRVVFLQGCSDHPDADAAALERLARDVPDVMQAVATVFDGRGRPPYRTLPSGGD